MWRRWLWIVLSLTLLLAALLAGLIESAQIPPRSLAAYLERRAAGHAELISGITHALATSLRQRDRGNAAEMPGAVRPMPVALPPRSSGALVSSAEQLIQAIAQAAPGDVITLLPGRYRFSGKAIAVERAGRANAGIVVRAQAADTVWLEFDLEEGFLVSAPYWTFENLQIRGICRDHSRCEHAFHVVAGAEHFALKNSYLFDFNAHLKINGAEGRMPDHGLIEGNVLSNNGVRATAHPVTPIDLVAASGWLIRRNIISDFVKAEGDRISYGAFAKGAGSGNRFEHNIVLCEQRLRDWPGQRVGLSLGGGGTDSKVCRDRRCITEQEGSVIQGNLIAACSDDGIYLNRAATSQIAHNTLLDTGGIELRHPESTADVSGNLVDGLIRSRDGGLLRERDNTATTALELYLGRHPVREWFVDAGRLNLAWRSDARPQGQRKTDLPDLCGGKASTLRGASADYAACGAH